MARDTRSILIRAAAEIIASQGVQNLTMDAVAAKAGVSKGTIFYQFISKEGLITGMMDELIRIIEDRIRKVQQNDNAPGSWLRGFIASSIVQEDSSDELQSLSFALVAAVSNDLKLLEPLIARQGDWRRSILADGIDPITAHIVRLAADGLWFNDIMGTPVLDADERKAVLDRLIHLTTQT